MPNSEHEEIIRACRVHKSIRQNLVATPIIRQRPSNPGVQHPVRFLRQTDEDVAAQKGILKRVEERDGVIHPRIATFDEAFALAAARDFLHWGIPYYAKKDLFEELVAFQTDQGKCAEWIKDPNHDKLMQMLQTGIIPDDSGLDYSMYARPLKTAIDQAMRRGQGRIPQQAQPSTTTSYGEDEASWDLRTIMRKGILEAAIVKDSTSRCALRSLVSNFAVPNPTRSGESSLYVDFLLVVLLPGPAVRLIAIEIDGEHHLDPERQRSDEARDEILSKLGYEVWRVAGWWCRVDALRVMAELLVEANILPDAELVIGESSLGDISTYICGVCEKPMVRFDDDWIVEWDDDGDAGKAHKCCYRE